MTIPNLRKYISLLVAALTFLLIWILPHLGVEIIFKSESERIIASLLVGIFFHTFQLFNEIENHKRDTSDTIKASITRIVDVLKVQNEYFDDQWLYRTLDNIVDIVRFTKFNKHDLKETQDKINESLFDARANIGAPREKGNIPEWDRIGLLNEAMDNSERYVQAVTIDVRNYFIHFWENLNRDKYSIANLNAAKRKIKIQRIFVMDGSVLKKDKGDKTKSFWEIVTLLKKGEPYVETYVLDLKSFIEKFDFPDTSFFICDDVLASESGTKPDNSGGYLAYNTKEKCIDLKRRFEILLENSKRI